MTDLAQAIEQLRSHQTQLDADGVMVGVSREALEIVLAHVASADAVTGVLREAVALYGKPGGPWNVPSDPGGWLSRARAALAQAEAGGEGA